MPADFFGHHQSLHIKSSKNKVAIKDSENKVLDEFIRMFKMSRELKKIAKKLH